MSQTTNIDGSAFVWMACFSLPYVCFFLFKWKYTIVDFLKPRRLHRNLGEGIGLVIYPILIDFFSSRGHSNISVSLIISYLLFIAVIIYISYSIEKRTEKEFESKQNEIDELSNGLAKIKDENTILLKFNKLERYVEEAIKLKSERFLESYKEFKASGKEILGNDIFSTITRPDLQLNELYGIIQRFFEDIFCDDDEELEYSVMEPSGEQLQFTAFSKRPRSLEAPEYIAGTAYTKGSGYTSSTAWEIGDIVVIEDIKKELEKPRKDRKYQTTDQHDARTENGCIISFPIFDKELKDNFPDGLICVINIISKKPLIFLEEKKGYYIKLLESLSYRIILENRLALLKSLLPKKEASRA